MCFAKANMVVMKTYGGGCVCTHREYRSVKSLGSLHARGEGRRSEALHREHRGDRGLQGPRKKAGRPRLSLTLHLPCKDALSELSFSFHSEPYTVCTDTIPVL